MIFTNYTYCRLHVIPAGADMFTFQMLVIFITDFPIDSWLRDSTPLRDLLIIIKKSCASEFKLQGDWGSLVPQLRLGPRKELKATLFS